VEGRPEPDWDDVLETFRGEATAMLKDIASRMWVDCPGEQLKNEQDNEKRIQLPTSKIRVADRGGKLKDGYRQGFGNLPTGL